MLSWSGKYLQIAAKSNIVLNINKFHDFKFCSQKQNYGIFISFSMRYK